MVRRKSYVRIILSHILEFYISAHETIRKIKKPMIILVSYSLNILDLDIYINIDRLE